MYVNNYIFQCKLCNQNLIKLYSYKITGITSISRRFEITDINNTFENKLISLS